MRSMTMSEAQKTLPTDRLPVRDLFWQTGLLILAFMPITWIAMQDDPRLLNGISVWIKPLKFQAAVAMHMATLALVTWLVAKPALENRAFRALALVCSTASVFEIAYITLQAARGQASHFNTGTPVYEALYAVMGVGAVVLVVTALVMGILVLRRPSGSGSPGLVWGTGLGLIVGAILTLIVAGVLSSGSGHWVGGTHSDAGGFPIMGWSRDGGDLRVSHFFATHMMQVVPVIGLAADRFTNRPLPIVVIASILGTVLTVATFVQALMGQPFLGFLG